MWSIGIDETWRFDSTGEKQKSEEEIEEERDVIIEQEKTKDRTKLLSEENYKKIPTMLSEIPERDPAAKKYLHEKQVMEENERKRRRI